ncbi:hypothetical protein CCR87_16070 [Rhodobaculum claviforme]|uniref:TspO and MBR related proteins n=2 Tax=Rhodobaculum claviforme TaxID=1549854 RepID=A0A934TPK3_9RHOB|nr:hypothetical protein [Rhodobaculum claviforme]
MKAILVVVAAVTFIASPLFTSGFGGFDPNLFPIPQVRPPVQPAGYAFSIWGLIYVWLLAHAGYGLLMRAEDAAWDAGRWWLIASLGVGASWIAVANTNAPWATVLIWVMLAGALGALWHAPGAAGPRDRWLGQAPLGIYAGWLTAASWVAVGFMLGGYGVLAPIWAAAVCLLAAAAMAVTVQLRLPQVPEYGITVVWALVAVVVANATRSWPIAGLAIVAVAAMMLTLARAAALRSGTRA